MSFVFPELMDDEMLVRAYAPFSPSSLFSTRKYREVFGAQNVRISQALGHAQRRFYRENMLFAYRMLFHLHYGVEAKHGAFVKQVRDGATGLDRFFMNEGSFRFVEVSYPGKELPPQHEFSRLLDMEDLETLVERLPLDGVVFSGFLYIRYVDITELHNLSLLKSELVEPDMLNSPDRYARIVQRLRSVLQVPDLDSGLTLRYKSGLEYRHCAARSLLRDFEGGVDDIESTIYGDPIRTQEPFFVSDLSECDCDSDIVAHLKLRGVRSVGLIPLLEGGEVICILELTSKQPNEIHPSSARKLADVLAPLTIAARREMDESQGRIERTIKAHCTAIHPSVGWRFEEAAYRYNAELRRDGHGPLRGHRLRSRPPALRRHGHPRLVRQPQHRDPGRSRRAPRPRPRHARPHLRAPPDAHRRLLRRRRSSSSARPSRRVSARATRSASSTSCTRASSPSSSTSASTCPSRWRKASRIRSTPTTRTWIPSMRILYQRRKEYEDSVSLINESLGKLVDEEEERAQAIFPHYFEKYKTDGVEYNIYIGQSMTRALAFDDVQLKNLRLWQLQLMCKMARRAEELVPQMKVPLRTTPLVLVHASPLTIHFSTESKQFEVEGSYNIRYEIIKKRIDKATVKGTNERLTQPGQLAVIYTQDKEREEYTRYLEYLREKGFLHGEVESLELDDLQGVHGLRALRAPIALD